MNRYAEDTLLRIDGTVPLLDPVAMRLYLAIVRLADGPHGTCHEPITRIAARTGLDYTEALEARRRLSAAGLVTQHHERHGDIVHWSYTPRVQQPAGARMPRLDAYIHPDLDDAGLSPKALAVLAVAVRNWPTEKRDVFQLAEVRNGREVRNILDKLDSLGLLNEDRDVFRNYPGALIRRETTPPPPEPVPPQPRRKQTEQPHPMFAGATPQEREAIAETLHQHTEPVTDTNCAIWAPADDDAAGLPGTQYNTGTIYVPNYRDPERRAITYLGPHRVAYALHHGIDTPPRYLKRMCSTAGCINPEHYHPVSAPCFTPENDPRPVTHPSSPPAGLLDQEGMKA